MNAATDPDQPSSVSTNPAEIELDTLREDAERGLAAAQTASLYRRSGVWLIPALAAAGLLAYALKENVTTEILSLWLATVFSVNLSQAILLRSFYHAPRWQDHHRPWRSGFVLGWALTGLCWGAAAIFMFPDQSIPHQALMGMIITGLSVGLVWPLSSVLLASLGFLFFSMGPLIFNLISQSESDLQEKLGHVLLILLLAMVMAAIRISRNTARSLRLELQNQATIEKAKALNETLKEEISERRKAEQEMNMAKDEAESAARAKGDFLATVSHEIRTPMNGVLGMLELLREMELGEEQLDLVNTAHYSAESLLSIINDVLDFSRIEMGEMELENIEFNLPRTMKDVAALMKRRAEEKGIYVRMGPLTSGTPSTVVGDPTRLRQILINLVGNAVKFTYQGGVDVGVTLMRRTPSNVILRFEVRDTGIGITQAAVKKLFQPFSQADSSMARKYGGSGLGLSIAKHLVTLMGGQINVESRPGSGSLFWFTVPFYISNHTHENVRRTVDGTRTLIIGSEDAEKQILKQLLQQWQTNLDTATSPNEAMKKMAELASIGQTWLYQTIILCPSVTHNQLEELMQELSRDAALSSIAIIAFGSTDKPQQETFPSGMVTRLSLPINAEELYRAVADSTISQKPGSATRGHPAGAEMLDRPTSSPGDALPAAPQQKQDRAATSLLAAHRVLVVEDNLVNQKVAKGLLSRIGLEVDLAADGRQALEISSKTDYSLIFMDCQMPVMDGFEATRRIRQREKESNLPPIPIVAMTGNAMEGDRKRCLEAGMNDYMTKPVKREALTDILQRHLAQENPSPPPSPALPAHKSARLLLVEDNPVNQKVTRNLVLKMGFEVDTANDGFEGVESAYSGKYSAILMDCQMPGMDGYEATRIIRADEIETGRPRIPIIAVTANAMEGDRERCIVSGMDDYLAKPVKRAILAEMLEKWLPHNPQETEQNTMTEQDPPNNHAAVDQAILEELKDIMEDNFADLVHTYLQDAPRLLTEIRDAIKGTDARQLGTSAHTLKSSSANLGALHLSSLAMKMELLGRSGTTRGCSIPFNEALQELRRVREALKSAL